MSKTTQTAINQAAWTEASTETDPDPPIPQRELATDAPGEDPTAAYCESCDRHLPPGTPDIRAAVADNDGKIGACARLECEGDEYSTHTKAALEARARQHGSRTDAGVGR